MNRSRLHAIIGSGHIIGSLTGGDDLDTIEGVRA